MLYRAGLVLGFPIKIEKHYKRKLYPPVHVLILFALSYSLTSSRRPTYELYVEVIKDTTALSGRSLIGSNATKFTYVTVRIKS